MCHITAEITGHTEADYYEPICPNGVRDREHIPRKPFLSVSGWSRLRCAVAAVTRGNAAQATQI
jgi:hypothetical protein